MEKVKIITDSAADLPRDLRTELGIDVVSLSVRFDSEEITDTANLDPELFWKKCQQSPTLPSTSAPSPGDFQQALNRAIKEGFSHAIIVTLSSKMSATYSAAVKAQELLKDQIICEVIDSQTVTGAQALLTIELAKMVQTGNPFDDIVNNGKMLIDKTRLLGVVDTLEYLKKGGRIGSASAFVGSLLSIKPVIEVRNGQVEAESRQRTLTKALDYVIEKAKKDLPFNSLAMIHANSPIAESFLEKLKTSFAPMTPIVIEIGPIIGSHTGPGAIGVAYILK